MSSQFNIIRIKYLVLFFLQVPVIFGQAKFDSVYNSIKSQPDTSQIKSLNEIVWESRNNDMQLALKCGQKALSLARSIGNRHLEARTLNLLGVVNRREGKNELGLKRFFSALSVAEECKDSTEIAYALNNIGGTYRQQACYSLALENNLRAYMIFERRKDKRGMGFGAINIAWIYYRQHNYSKALEYFNLTARIREELHDRPGRALALSGIAEIYVETKDYKIALEKFNQLEIECRQLNDATGIMSALESMGRVYFLQEDYTNALKYHQSSLELAKKIGGPNGLIINNRNIGVINASMGRLKEGYKALLSSLRIARGSKDKYEILGCYESFSRYYELSGDLHNALKFARFHSALTDSIVTEESVAGIGLMEETYKNEKAKTNNAILQKNIEMSSSQRNYWIIITLLLFVSSGVIYSRFLSKKKANKKLHELNSMKDKFFGIIAHDLKNPFHTILGITSILKNNFMDLSEEEKSELICELDNSGRKTYKLLENLLYWSMSQTGRLEFNPGAINLPDMVNETFELLDRQARNKNISLSLKTAGAAEAFADGEMIKTVLRNLISNAIKFTNSGGSVSVEVQSSNGLCEIAIEDNGLGIPEAVQEKLFSIDNVSASKGTHGEHGTGLGLVLCKEFAEKNNGQISFTTQEGKGSKFTIKIPSAAS